MALIDRNEICSCCAYHEEKWLCGICRVGNAKEIDAVPVVHAYWHNHSRFIATDEFGEEIVFVEQQCSNCNLWNIRMDRHIERKYCPHCGARMDGEAE